VQIRSDTNYSIEQAANRRLTGPRFGLGACE